MKSIVQLVILSFAFFQYRSSLGIEDTNVIAMGAWSDPVSNEYGGSLRGRLLLCAYPDHRGGPTNRVDVGVYVELQEYSDSMGRALQVYCDFTKGLKCYVSDLHGNPPEPVGTGFSGGAPGPIWVTLPSFASTRLRANVFAGGRLRDGSLGLWFAGAGVWTIKARDTNTYFLRAEMTVDPPANTNSLNHTEIWRGTLKLPSLKIPVSQP